MVQCCAFGCHNSGTHLFPKDNRLKKQWIEALKRKHFVPTKHSRLCSDHFKQEDFRNEGFFSGLQNTKKILKKGKVPSIFKLLRSEDSLEDPAAEGRRKRAENRATRRNLFFKNKSEQQVPLGQLGEKIAHSSEILEQEFIQETEVAADDQSHVPDENTISDIPSFNSAGTQKNYQFYTVETFRNDDRGILFYTGLESFEKFLFVFNTLCPEAYSLRYRWSQVINVSAEDQFLLTLMKLRRNKEDYELSRFFGVHQSTVSNIFVTWVNFMHQMWGMLDTWPSREMINFYMPEGFTKLYPTTRVIVDCTEIPIQKPTNPAAQQAVWSSYKNRSTAKVEVGASPSGLLSHCSEAYGGSTSDRQIVERSSMLEKCDPGDSIMADRGFNVQDLFAAKSVAINIPTFFKGKCQLPGLTVLHDRKLSSKRVHIERLIGLTKTYKLLQTPVNKCYIPLMSKLYFVCQMLCNFREGIVSKNA